MDISEHLEVLRVLVRSGVRIVPSPLSNQPIAGGPFDVSISGTRIWEDHGDSVFLGMRSESGFNWEVVMCA